MDMANILRKLAIRLQDVANLTSEDISVNPHDFPGGLKTIGGPEQKQHGNHQLTGPRGEASCEDEDDIEEDE